MIGAILGGAIGYVVGSKIDDSRPLREVPIWSGQVAGAVLTITEGRWQNRQFWRLYVAMGGQSAMVAQGTYPELMAAMQIWEPYLTGGGTLSGWMLQNELRAGEVQKLNQSL